MSEAGGGPISEMSETGARSATISSADDIASGSWGHGLHEIQGEELYEIPENTRIYEAPDQQRLEASGLNPYNPPGHNPDWRPTRG
jgi:hypothetical protein